MQVDLNRHQLATLYKSAGVRKAKMQQVKFREPLMEQQQTYKLMMDVNSWLQNGGELAYLDECCFNQHDQCVETYAPPGKQVQEFKGIFQLPEDEKYVAVCAFILHDGTFRWIK